MNDMDRLQLVKEMVESYMTGDFGPVMEALSDDVTLRLTIQDGTPLSGTFKGKDGVGEYFGRNAATVEPTSMEVLNYLAGGNQVAVVGRETLTVKQSGKVMKDADWVILCTFGGTKIAEIAIIEDTSEIANAYHAK